MSSETTLITYQVRKTTMIEYKFIPTKNNSNEQRMLYERQISELIRIGSVKARQTDAILRKLERIRKEIESL